jgi:hypothetical protein
MINLFIFVVGYLLFLATLSLIARPYRMRLISVSESLLSDNVTESEKQFIGHVTKTAYSVRTAPMLFLVFAMGLLKTSQSIDANQGDFEKNHPVLTDGNRSHELLEMHMASAAAVNPIFGALAYAAKWAFKIKTRAYFEKNNGQPINIDIFEMRAVV